MNELERNKAIIERLLALHQDPDVLRKAAARTLARLPPVESTQLLESVIQISREGWEPAIRVLPAFLGALWMEAVEIPYVETLRRVAALQELLATEAVLGAGAAQKEYDERTAKKADALMFSQPLGYLKQKARLTKNPDELARLAASSDASVVKNVLQNPRLTEDVVVRIAARRPARPEPLVEIWKTSRWSTRHSVRRALVFNPFLPIEIGTKIVPLLNRTDLRELSNDKKLHPSLRRQADVLLERDQGGEPAGDEAPRGPLPRA